MGQQSVRQQARRAALDVQSKRRRERAERDRRLERLAVDVLVAIRERDAAVAQAERRAGQALRTMTDHEGLSLRDAVAWCGGGLTAREAARLRRLIETAGLGGQQRADDAADVDVAANDEPSARTPPPARRRRCHGGAA